MNLAYRNPSAWPYPPTRWWWRTRSVSTRAGGALHRRCGSRYGGFGPRNPFLPWTSLDPLLNMAGRRNDDGYLVTVTATGADANPLAMTSSLLAPVSIPAGRVKLAVDAAFGVIAIVLKPNVRA